MSGTEGRTISLPHEHAAFIDEQVASRNYVSASEVVRAGLHALQERNTVVARWLERAVAPAYDALREDPDRARPASDAFTDLRTRHATAIKGNG